MNVNVKFFLVSLSLFLLAACSSTNRAYLDSLQLAFEDRSAQLTVAQIKQSRGDLLQVKSGERPAAVMALAYIENDRYRWKSGDDVVFTMHHGVLVTTQGLANDLQHTSNLGSNPLAQQGKLAFQWQRKIDIAGTGYGIPVSSRWEFAGETRLEILDTTFNTLLVTEQVTVAAATPFLDPDRTWQNQYWLDSATKTLLSSRQKFSPQGDWYEMTYLSRAVRHMEEAQ
ncbi:YjbF family lipoprotein [Alteromonas sp. ASW11-19]|uniref:YjbF family lipoprotein n=1 Tax=Alteromonas salexigens TaxID=2982530 RepID=A0ABT2VP13_9ALTE|nr:YjbF family lipoprotein [Alteromonas salexigens]MCU7554814.1 YjbF family lipoprotein [Alteromonas salexigens]